MSNNRPRPHYQPPPELINQRILDFTHLHDEDNHQLTASHNDIFRRTSPADGIPVYQSASQNSIQYSQPSPARTHHRTTRLESVNIYIH